MTNAEALKFAEEMQDKLSYRLEFAQNVPARSFYENQRKMLFYAISAMREKQKRENPKPLTEEQLRQMMGEPVWCVYEGGASWFIVHESLFTVLNGMTAYRHKPSDFGEVNKIAQMTNADRIRALTDEELAERLQEDFCPEDHDSCDENCQLCWLRWLQQPAEEEKIMRDIICMVLLVLFLAIAIIGVSAKSRED